MLTRIMKLSFRSEDAAVSHREVAIHETVIAGWTGRDTMALEKHIRELEELGVKRPASTPIFYRVATARLTLEGDVEATGTESSGEAEFIVLRDGGRLWIGVGSDHTDRQVETYGVTFSKQMCDKPMAAEFWAFDDVKPHWDALVLRSYIAEGEARTLYQEGSVAAMLDPENLIARYRAGGGVFEDGTLMFCGTLAARGGIRPSARFEFELEDPIRQMAIRQGYNIVTLPVLG